MTLPAANLLAEEASPYLRQHQDNPVHWRAWKPESLAEARERGRPILLSIGYAACHWCHVMAHESFENPEIAALMNRLFVNIKVDREERPDIDQIFMAALTAMGEQGGWPLTMFLTPDARPFWGGTYFPPAPRYGRPGFPQVLEAVDKAWREKETSISESADALLSHVRSRLAGSAPGIDLEAESLRQLASNIERMVDPSLGGLRGAPKFPNAPFMQALWLGWLDGRHASMRDAFLLSYRAMLNGGIYDHLGGGLCRYSTDDEWMIPHFEKMLYDNAQLIRHANWAYAESSEALFRERIEQTVGWLRDEMRGPDGAFTASLDADSEGEEGRFYMWTPADLSSVLGPDLALFQKYYGLGTSAHWEGDPVIYRRGGAPVDDSEREGLTAALRRLSQARDARVRPGRDEKILVDWNGLTIVALCEAGRSLGRSDWIAMAREAYEAILKRRDGEGRLPHAYLGTAAVYPALSTDYASMISAAIALFEATHSLRYVEDARGFADLLDTWHADAEGFMLTASDAGDVPMRIRGDVDEATPSATGQVIEALARLANLTGDTRLQELAINAGRHAAARAAGQAYGQAGIVNANAILLEARKLVIVTDPDSDVLVPEANRSPDPRRVDMVVQKGSAGAVLADGSTPPTDRVGAYLCLGQRCLAPVAGAGELRSALREA